jgi:pectate lyase
MAGAPKSSRIVFLLPLLLLGATASSLPLLNSSVPDPAAVVADFHRYLISGNLAEPMSN